MNAMRRSAKLRPHRPLGNRRRTFGMRSWNKSTPSAIYHAECNNSLGLPPGRDFLQVARPGAATPAARPSLSPQAGEGNGEGHFARPEICSAAAGCAVAPAPSGDREALIIFSARRGQAGRALRVGKLAAMTKQSTKQQTHSLVRLPHQGHGRISLTGLAAIGLFDWRRRRKAAGIAGSGGNKPRGQPLGATDDPAATTVRPGLAGRPEAAAVEATAPRRAPRSRARCRPRADRRRPLAYMSRLRPACSEHGTARAAASSELPELTSSLPPARRRRVP
jgi:hypothetical protein